jgi:hypothetical protein
MFHRLRGGGACCGSLIPFSFPLSQLTLPMFVSNVESGRLRGTSKLFRADPMQFRVRMAAMRALFASEAPDAAAAAVTATAATTAVTAAASCSGSTPVTSTRPPTRGLVVAPPTLPGGGARRLRAVALGTILPPASPGSDAPFDDDEALDPPATTAGATPSASAAVGVVEGAAADLASSTAPAAAPTGALGGPSAVSAPAGAGAGAGAATGAATGVSPPAVAFGAASTGSVGGGEPVGGPRSAALSSASASSAEQECPEEEVLSHQGDVSVRATANHSVVVAGMAATEVALITVEAVSASAAVAVGAPERRQGVGAWNPWECVVQVVTVLCVLVTCRAARGCKGQSSVVWGCVGLSRAGYRAGLGCWAVWDCVGQHGLWGGVGLCGRCVAVPGGVGRGMGRCGAVQGGVERYGAVWGGVGRCLSGRHAVGAVRGCGLGARGGDGGGGGGDGVRGLRYLLDRDCACLLPCSPNLTQTLSCAWT